MAEPYDDFKGYVRGGGRFVQLISRDLVRLEGACIKVAREGKKRLVRWDDHSFSLHVYCFETEDWVAFVVDGVAVVVKDNTTESEDFNRMLESYPELDKGEPKSFTDVVKCFSNDSVVNDLLIWLPLYAPLLSHDGGEGTRDLGLLQNNLKLAKWALEKSNGPNPSDSDTWKGKTVVVSGFREDLPEELSDICQRIHWSYPTREEIYKLLTGYTAEYDNGRFRHTGSNPNRDSILEDFGCHNQQDDYFEMMWGSSLLDIVSAARGLDLQDCKVSILSAIRNKELESDSDDVHKQVMDTKVSILDRDGLLKVEPKSGDKVVGLQKLQSWILSKKPLFQHPDIAVQHGIKPLKGLLLTGVPGCGKSLIAKEIASERGLDVPLVSFDLGNLMNRYVGQTEENMNRALRQAEGMAPCVLWIDEFEKMFASAGNDQSSHEVTQRINAAFLKWMEEKAEAVFVVATSNDLSNIKAEYTRTGRWDSTFFFDLPSLHERQQILKLNLDSFAGKGGHEVTEEEMMNVSQELEGWASSDVAQLAKNAKMCAFESLGTNLSMQSTITMEHVRQVLDQGLISPMMDKDKVRLYNIRSEGVNYPPASIYDAGDIAVPLAPPEYTTQSAAEDNHRRE